MTIVFFNSCKKWGGGEKWHFENLAELKNKNIKTVAFANKKSLLHKKFLSLNTKVYPINISTLSLLNPIKLILLYRIFKSLNASTILLNLPADVKVAGPIAKLAGIKNIVYRRGSAIPIKNSISNRFLFKHIVTNILTNSNKTASTILEKNPKLFAKSKIEIIYNGISTNDFINLKYKPIYTKNDDCIILGNLARLSHQKGQADLIKLALDLRAQKINFKILIGGDGELESKLKNEAIIKGVEHEVIFLGFIENAKDFLSSIDIFVFPSRWEGFGFSLVEAKLMKKPIVAYNASSNPEIIQDTIDGYLAKPFDKNDLFEKVQFLINHPQKRKEMGEQGYKDAIQRFDKSISTNKLINFLNNLS